MGEDTRPSRGPDKKTLLTVQERDHGDQWSFPGTPPSPALTWSRKPGPQLGLGPDLTSPTPCHSPDPGSASNPAPHVKHGRAS
jgi:hypothetical protein